MKNIVYYKKENWKIPFYEFINNINKKLFSKVFFKLELLASDLLWVDDVKYIKDKIYELRIKDENNIIRVFYFSKINNEIVVLDWYVKKENKLKKQILDRIILYKNDYLKRIW